MRLTVVGCGTVVPEADRGGSCYFVEHGGTRALLDCGPGAVQALERHGVSWQRVTHLLLSHFHSDHVGALPGLFFAFRHGIFPARTEPLEVWGPSGTRELFRRLAEALGDFFLDPGFGLSIRELSPGAATSAGDVEVEFRRVPHTAESVAMRLDAGPGGVLGYTGDTGPDEGLAEFFRDADVLLAECSLPDELVGDNHLSPGRLGRLARQAAARRLVVTHVYPQFRRATDVPGLITQAGYPGPVSLAVEGLTVDVRPPPA